MLHVLAIPQINPTSFSIVGGSVMSNAAGPSQQPSKYDQTRYMATGSVQKGNLVRLNNSSEPASANIVNPAAISSCSAAGDGMSLITEACVLLLPCSLECGQAMAH